MPIFKNSLALEPTNPCCQHILSLYTSIAFLHNHSIPALKCFPEVSLYTITLHQHSNSVTVRRLLLCYIAVTPCD